MRRLTPQQYNWTPSRERLHELADLVTEQGGTIPDDFDIDAIHWVTDRIGITDFEGCAEAVVRGYLVINVAGELDSSAQVQADINPHSNNVKPILDKLAKLIDKTMADDDTTKVVVHCAMGMERSPLTVVWYLHTYQDMSLDEAYKTVQTARPVAVDRRYWIKE